MEMITPVPSPETVALTIVTIIIIGIVMVGFFILSGPWAYRGRKPVTNLSQMSLRQMERMALIPDTYHESESNNLPKKEEVTPIEKGPEFTGIRAIQL